MKNCGAGGLGGREDATFTDITESIHIHKNSMNFFCLFVCLFSVWIFVCLFFTYIWAFELSIRKEKCEYVSLERFKERSQTSRMTYRMLTEDDRAEGIQKDLRGLS